MLNPALNFNLHYRIREIFWRCKVSLTLWRTRGCDGFSELWPFPELSVGTRVSASQQHIRAAAIQSAKPELAVFLRRNSEETEWHKHTARMELLLGSEEEHLQNIQNYCWCVSFYVISRFKNAVTAQFLPFKTPYAPFSLRALNTFTY